MIKLKKIIMFPKIITRVLLCCLCYYLVLVYDKYATKRNLEKNHNINCMTFETLDNHFKHIYSVSDKQMYYKTIKNKMEQICNQKWLDRKIQESLNNIKYPSITYLILVYSFMEFLIFDILSKFVM